MIVKALEKLKKKKVGQYHKNILTMNINGLKGTKMPPKLFLKCDVELGLLVKFLSMFEGKYLIKFTSFMSGLNLNTVMSYIIKSTLTEDWT